MAPARPSMVGVDAIDMHCVGDLLDDRDRQPEEIITIVKFSVKTFSLLDDNTHT